MLHLPDFSKTFFVRTDASNKGIGAVLLQDHDGIMFPVAFASRKLLLREQNYSTIERECLAIVWTLQKFELYLSGRFFCNPNRSSASCSYKQSQSYKQMNHALGNDSPRVQISD